MSLDPFDGEDMAAVTDLPLNKSTFLQGVQCKKALMLNALQPELAPPPDAGVQFRMRLGQQVGQVAQSSLPGGKSWTRPGFLPGVAGAHPRSDRRRGGR